MTNHKYARNLQATPPPQLLFDTTPQLASSYFHSPSSDVSPVMAQPGHFATTPFHYTTPVLPESASFMVTNFSPVATKGPMSAAGSDFSAPSSFYAQPVLPNASNGSLDGLGVFTSPQASGARFPPPTSSPASASRFPVLEFPSPQATSTVRLPATSSSPITSTGQFVTAGPQIPFQESGLAPELTLTHSTEPTDFDSPTTIEVSSTHSSNHASNGDGDFSADFSADVTADITADDILNGDPFEALESGSARKFSDDIVSSFVDFELAGDKSSEELEPADFKMDKFSTLLGSLDPIKEDANATKSTPTLKKQASNSKINKKTLKKSSSFSGQTFAIPLASNASRDPKRTKPPSISFRECSQRFSVSSLNNKYSFVYENGNEDENQPKLQKSQSSVSVRQLEQSHRIHSHYQYDNRGTHANGDNSPRVLRNMKAGMVEFQVNLGSSKGSG